MSPFSKLTDVSVWIDTGIPLISVIFWRRAPCFSDPISIVNEDLFFDLMLLGFSPIFVCSTFSNSHGFSFHLSSSFRVHSKKQHDFFCCGATYSLFSLRICFALIRLHRSRACTFSISCSFSSLGQSLCGDLRCSECIWVQVQCS